MQEELTPSIASEKYPPLPPQLKTDLYQINKEIYSGTIKWVCHARMSNVNKKIWSEGNMLLVHLLSHSLF